MRTGTDRRYALIPLFVLGASLVGRASDRYGDSDISELVGQLDAESFHARQTAAQELIAIGTLPTEDVRSDVTAALKRCLHHPSLEARSAAGEILLKIRQIDRDDQLDRLGNPRCKATDIHLAGWPAFRRLAGDDMGARRLFANLCEQYPRELQELQREETSSDSLKRLAIALDPYRLPPQDAVAWTMLILLDTEWGNRSGPDMAPRIAMALSNATMGPKVAAQRDARVLRQLIEHWIVDRANNHAARERLLIAMRYECRTAASEICAQVLADRSAPAGTLVTALLCASALGQSDIETQARLRLDDQRTAHVWQLIASRRTKIRTQVRDVAMAVLLHHHGIDPRRAGFDELQADPILIFRDHSLGFPNDFARRRSHMTALNLLSTRTSP